MMQASIASSHPGSRSAIYGPHKMDVGRGARQIGRHAVQERAGDDEVDRRQTVRHSAQQRGVEALLHDTHVAHDRPAPASLRLLHPAGGPPQLRIDGVEEDVAPVAEPDLLQRLLADADHHVRPQAGELIPGLYSRPPGPWVKAPVVDHVHDQQIVRQAQRSADQTRVRDQGHHRPTVTSAVATLPAGRARESVSLSLRAQSLLPGSGSG